MYKFILILCLFITTGCGQKNTETVLDTKEFKKSIFQKLGLSGPSKEEIEAKRELDAQQLQEADALVAKWADLVQTGTNPAAGFGFKRIEGLTDIDPWGQQIKINYHQKWFKEIATIQSAGPDGLINSEDDLIRTRSTSNPLGIFEGMSTFGWIVFIWVICSSLAFAFSAGIGNRRASKGKSKHHKHPLGFTIATVVFAPLTSLLYGFQFIGGSFINDSMGVSDFFDGFDFVDIDIDL